MEVCGCYVEDNALVVGHAQGVESLTELMKKTSAAAGEVLQMAQKINGHLFGLDNLCGGEEASPKCFRDELAKTRAELVATEEELTRICTLLGV